jgi:hypothetical protein
MLLEPVLVGLDGERPHQPQATFAIGEDAHDLKRVAQKMDVAALIGRLRQNFAQRCPQAGMIIGHDELCDGPGSLDSFRGGIIRIS